MFFTIQIERKIGYIHKLFILRNTQSVNYNTKWIVWIPLRPKGYIEASLKGYRSAYIPLGTPADKTEGNHARA